MKSNAYSRLLGLDAVRRLLRWSAKPDTPVGYADVSVTLMPVMTGLPGCP